MGILLYEILEHTFHFVKMEINQILNLLKRPTASVSRWWAGWDSAGEQRKPEA
jgi:hypothetical protein